MKSWLLSAFLLVAPAAALEVRIVQPAPGEPLFGEVVVQAEVSSAGAPVRKVEFYLNGTLAGVAEAPPYRVLVDTGEEGRAHRLEVVAHGSDGSRATATLASPRLETDLEIRVDLQQLFVTVERNGRPVSNLTRDDFTVLDQGTPQPIVTFGRGDVPFTAVLLVDASASMQGRRLETALDGARSFLAALQPLDQAKLLLFSDHVRLETPFTNLQPVLTLGLRGVEAGGGTALNDALYLALRRLQARPGRKVAVLLSDGVDIESVLSMEEVRAIARRQVTLYWLRLGSAGSGGGLKVVRTTAWRGAGDQQRESDLLRSAVLESGGRIVDLTGIDQVPAALAALLAELRDQYVLGIAPRRTRGRGTWHEVKVEVRGGLTARTQDGYFEP